MFVQGMVVIQPTGSRILDCDLWGSLGVVDGMGLNNVYDGTIVDLPPNTNSIKKNYYQIFKYKFPHSNTKIVPATTLNESFATIYYCYYY